MRGLTVQYLDLSEALKPAASFLDGCWWYLNGTGMSFPSVRLPTQLVDPKKIRPGMEYRDRFDAADLARYDAEYDAAVHEYSKWVGSEGDGRGIGKPGFFSRYAAGMACNWKMYCASDAAAIPTESFDAFERDFNHRWFVPPPELPPDICVIVRDVDAAYLDIFFRDEWMYELVWWHLVNSQMNPKEYKARNSTK